MRIAGGHSGLVGNNIYGSLKRESVTQSGGARAKLRWQISVQNDAKISDSIRVRGAKSQAGYQVKYLSASGANVTKAVEAGTFRTPTLKAGAAYKLTVVVTITRKAASGRSFVGKVQGFSVHSPSRTDAVAFVAHRD